MPQVSADVQVAGPQESIERMIARWKELVDIRKQMVEWKIETTGIERVMADIFNVVHFKDSHCTGFTK